MAVKKDIWKLLSTVVISMVVFNFGLRYTANLNPELMDMVLGSTKLERFAEAIGYYTPVAIPDVATISEDSAARIIDVLDNDYDEDYNNSSYYFSEGDLWIISDTQITGIAGDTASTITVDTSANGTNDTAAQAQGVIPTHGAVSVDTSQNYHGPLTFSYEVCDNNPAALGDASIPGCATSTVTIDVEARNDIPQVDDFSIFTNQDTTYSFDPGASNPSLFEQNFQDPDQLFLDANPGSSPSASEGYDIQSVTITLLPSKGNLVLDDGSTQTPLTGITTVNIANINQLRYIPNPGETGADEFRWYASDGITSSIVFPDDIDISPQDTPVAPQSFGPVSIVDITINPVANPDPLILPGQDLTVKRGQTITSDPITATTDTSTTITGLNITGLPTFCTESTPTVNGNTLTCTAPIDEPLGPQTFTVDATDGLGRTTQTAFTITVEDYLEPIVSLSKDTPDNEIELDKQVCAIAQVANNNTYDLTNVKVGLTTDSGRAPFVTGTSVVNSTNIPGTTFTESEDQVEFLIPTLPANALGEVQTCANPQVTDVSFIDARSFVVGSDKITTANVQFAPMVEEEVQAGLVRTGAAKWAGTIMQLTIVEGFVTALLWIYYKMKRSRKNK